MRLLFDQNISFRITNILVDIFPDCKHVSDCGLMDSDDLDIWGYARKNNYSIVTFDADFYDISVINGHPPKIIWLRSGNLTTKGIVKLLMKNKNMIQRFLENEDYKDASCLEIE